MALRDAFAKRLLECCADAGLVRRPWEDMTERDRAEWRVIADTAMRWSLPGPEWMAALEAAHELAESVTARVHAEQRADALRRYARHLDGCPQDPCTCGLAAVLGSPAA